MRSISQSLVWKDWHEHKWKLAALVSVLGGVTLPFLSSELLGVRNDLRGARGMLIITIVPLAIFVGLGTAAGERSRNTLPFLQALPVSMWRVAVHKMVFGLMTVLAAGMAALGATYVWTRNAGWDAFQNSSQNVDPFSFGVHDWFVDTALALLCVAISFYIWTVATGVNRKDEISAGAIACVLMVTWTVLVFYGVYWLTQRSGWSNSAAVLPATMLMSTAPGGVVGTTIFSTEYKQNFFITGVWTAVITHLVLASVYVLRFGRVTNLQIRSPVNARRKASELDWLGLPRRSKLSAVAWKQFRESGPIVVAGLAGIIGVVGAVTLTAWWQGESLRIEDVYVPVSAFLGFVMALVIGIGICFYDVSPPLNLFWRSRPINPDLWFWCKYVTGLAVLLTAIYVPIFFLEAMSDGSGYWHTFQNSENIDVLRLPLMHVAMFSAAVAMMCLVRNAMYAAVLSLAFVYLGMLAGYGVWFAMGIFGWAPKHSFWRETTPPQDMAALITSFCISTLLAWLAMRFDWGRKSRY